MIRPALKFTILFVLLFGFFANPVEGQDSFFEKADLFLKKHIKEKRVDYKKIVRDTTMLQELIADIQAFPISNKDADTQKAFWINAYNLLTIYSISKQYPIDSPLDIPVLFTNNIIVVEGEELSLDQIEKIKLLKAFQDARIHFVIVCGAVSCSPIANFAYTPKSIDNQLDRQTKKAMDDTSFLKIIPSEKIVEISEIFRWYNFDFKSYGGIKSFINQFKTQPIPSDFQIKYYTFNWALNDLNTTNQPIRYRASVLLNKKSVELKVFNSMYTEKRFDGFDQLNSRSTYFSSYIQFLYGLNNKINIGGDIVIKSNVVNDFASSFPLETLNFRNQNIHKTIDCADANVNISPFSNCKENGMYRFDTLRMADGQVLETRSAAGLAHIGPKIKFNPVKKWSNLSLQQTLYIPIQKNVDGQLISFTQFFYDKPIKEHSQIFVEASLWAPLYPNIQVYPFLKAFYSYFPTSKWTIYGMVSLPLEVGAGTKYFITPNLELEFLYTYYLPVDSLLGGRRPMTFNIGFRYSK